MTYVATAEHLGRVGTDASVVMAVDPRRPYGPRRVPVKPWQRASGERAWARRRRPAAEL